MRPRAVTRCVSGRAVPTARGVGGESSPGPAQTSARSTGTGSRGVVWGNPLERSCRRLDRPWPGTELPNKRRGRDGDVGKSQSRQARPPSSSSRVLGVQHGNYRRESICDKASFGEVGVAGERSESTGAWGQGGAGPVPNSRTSAHSLSRTKSASALASADGCRSPVEIVPPLLASLCGQASGLPARPRAV